jgi:hypothetical protein
MSSLFEETPCKALEHMNTELVMEAMGHVSVSQPYWASLRTHCIS